MRYKMTSPWPPVVCNNWALISLTLKRKGERHGIKTSHLPDRIRKVPRQFSWIDHRLVRDHHIDRCSHGAAALYLFLVTVADAGGLSYYSDRTLSSGWAWMNWP